MYLANDLIQKSLLKISKGSCQLNYHEAFNECIEEVLDLVFDIFDQAVMFDVHFAMLKVIQVWINRKVYDVERL